MAAQPSVAPDEIILATQRRPTKVRDHRQNVSVLRDHLKDTDEPTVPVAATGALALLIDHFDDLVECLMAGATPSGVASLERADLAICARDQAARSPLGQDETSAARYRYR